LHKPFSLARDLEDFRRQFDQIADDADGLAGTLTNDQFNWRPGEARWSIAQCIEHLNVTARLYLPTLDEGIDEAIRRGLYGEGPFTYSLLTRAVLGLVEPPPRIRLKTPKAFLPPPERGRQETMAAFRAYQMQYVDRLRQANGLDLSRARVAHPGSRLVRIPLGTGFAIVCAHERRHLWQARQVRQDATFPGV
jgi:hypothetical protein